MISCLFCGVSLLYGYFVSKKILLLFIALLMFLLAAGCHHQLEKRIKFLEEQMRGVIDSLEKQVGVDRSIREILKKFVNYKERIGDDLK